MRRRILLASALALAACTGTTKKVPPTPPAPDAGPPPTPLHTTYRAISGVSMGAIGSSTVGFKHAELFDAIAPLGGPLDVRYFVGHFLEQSAMGGFCTIDQIE